MSRAARLPRAPGPFFASGANRGLTRKRSRPSGLLRSRSRAGQGEGRQSTRQIQSRRSPGRSAAVPARVDDVGGWARWATSSRSPTLTPLRLSARGRRRGGLVVGGAWVGCGRPWGLDRGRPWEAIVDVHGWLIVDVHAGSRVDVLGWPSLAGERTRPDPPSATAAFEVRASAASAAHHRSPTGQPGRAPPLLPRSARGTFHRSARVLAA